MKVWKVTMVSPNNTISAKFVRAKTLLHAMIIAGRMRALYFTDFTIYNIERV